MIDVDHGRARLDQHVARRTDLERAGLIDRAALPWVLATVRELHAAKRAVVGPDDVSVSYAELDEGVQAVAGRLLDDGIAAGDVVVVYAQNSVAWIESVLACWHVGAIALPIVTLYREHELRQILDQVDPRGLVSVEQARGRALAECLDDVVSGTRAKIVSRLLLDGTRPGWASRTDLAPRKVPPAPIAPDAPLLMLTTSGTMSAPKLVVHTSTSLLANARHWRYMHDWTSFDVSYLPVPLAHVAGIQRGVTVPFTSGATVVLRDGWDTSRWVSDMVGFGVSQTNVPALLLPEVMGLYDDAGRPDLAVRFMVAARMPGDDPSFVRAEDWGLNPTRTYGMTECPASTFHPTGSPFAARQATSGRPAPGVELRVVDEAGRELPPGEPGELLVGGPNQMLCYLDPELDRTVWTTDGLIRTGDVAVLTVSGEVAITGRLKEIINRGGEKFSAREVEEVILKHAGVQDVAVVPAPDRRLGEVPAAFVVGRDGVPLSAELLRAHLDASGVAKQKIPAAWRFVGELPRTGIHKIAKAELIARLQAEVRDTGSLPVEEVR